MPVLSIIPAAAVSDASVTDTQLRVLCAIGTFTNRLGGNVWASVPTLAKACQLSVRTIQRAVPALIAAGYLRRMERPGRTPIYEVVLERGVTAETLGGDSTVTTPPSGESPKREEERSPKRSSDRSIESLFAHSSFQAALHDVWQHYPPRPEPYSYVALRRTLGELFGQGVTTGQVTTAARQYAQHVLRTQTEKRYVKGIVSFFRDGFWEQYAQVTVHGRTRDEWARSGQDVSEFDRLASGAA
jgi:hypothetical protein